MRITIVDQDIPLAEDKRLIKRLYKVNKSDDFPDGLDSCTSKMTNGFRLPE